MIQIALNLGIVPIDWPRNNGANRMVRAKCLRKSLTLGYRIPISLY